MWFRLFLIAVCATSLWAQLPPFCRPTALDTYLGLVCGSPAWATIERNNEAHRDWRDQKERRVYQVRGEIVDETQRSPLDPTALGLRYAEIEAICREIDDREKQLVVVNRNALNEAQKTKVAALEEAMKLVQTGNQAILRKLMEGPPVGLVVLPASRISPTPVVVPSPQLAPAPRTGACALQNTTPVILGIPVQ